MIQDSLQAVLDEALHGHVEETANFFEFPLMTKALESVWMCS
jgi:hypothetical protein